LTIGDDRVLVQGVRGNANVADLRGLDKGTQQSVLAGEAVVVSRQLAKHHHLRGGGVLRLATPAGMQRARIAAIPDSFAWSRGTVVTSMETLERWFGRAGYSWVELAPSPGVSTSAALETVRNYNRRTSGR